MCIGIFNPSKLKEFHLEKNSFSSIFGVKDSNDDKDDNNDSNDDKDDNKYDNDDNVDDDQTMIFQLLCNG